MVAHLMNDRVEIFRLKKKPGEDNYGVPSQDEYYYSDVPDLVDVKCSIQKTGRQTLTTQEGPFETVIEYYSMYLPKDVEIFEKDKVIFKGAVLFAGIPFSYRTHTEVELRRNDRWQKTI